VATLPDAPDHNPDVYAFGGALYASSYPRPVSTILKSTDGGATWVPVGDEGYPGYFFELDGELYHADHLDVQRINANDTLTRFAKSEFAPDGAGQIGYFYRAVEVGGSAVLILDNGDQDHSPFGLYRTSGPGSSARIGLGAGVKARDLLVRSGVVYLLSSSVVGPGQVRNRVSRADATLANWQEVFYFDASTFARSFEEAGGDWYFGLGSNNGSLAAATGDVLRVPAASVPVP
jgi:hypothetical protein